MTIQIRQFEPDEELGELETAWQDIQRRGGISHPMYSSEWVSTWWQIFGEGRRLYVAVLKEGGQAQAVLPLVQRTATMNRMFPYDRFELMGTGEPQEEEVFSEYVDVPALPSATEGLVIKAAVGLLSMDAAPWDDLLLPRIVPGSLADRCFRAAAKELGTDAEEVGGGECPYVELPEEPDQYLYEVSKKRRKRLRRGMRELDDMGEYTFRKAQSLKEALAMLETLAELHQARWQARGEPGAFASERFFRFHRTFIRRTFDLGWPELWTLRLNGEPIACRYNIRYNGTVSCYIGGIRTLDNDKVRPGFLSHYLAIRNAIETGAKEYDFLLGDFYYKRSLSNRSRKLITLRICQADLKDSVRKGLASAVRGLRDLRPSWLGGEEE